MNTFDFSVQTQDGATVSLSEYRGKVLLIVNTATGCGFTPQYDALQDLYELHQTENTCSQIISLDLDGSIVHNGNLKAIPILIEGWTVEQIEEKLADVLCGRRPTSCADQLSKAVRSAYEAEQKGA